jgi:hypothetical protein
MSENLAISIVALLSILIGILCFKFITKINSGPKKDLSNITKNLESEVQWEECKNTSVSGYFNGYKISIALVPFNYIYCSYHISLYAKLQKQPLFMLSYPKLSENIEQRGNVLFATLPSMSIEQEKSIYKQVHETLKTMALLAAQYEKNA